MKFISYGKQFLDSNDLKSVNKSLKKNKLTTGPLTDNFEKLNLNNSIALIARYYTNRYNKFSLGYIIENEHYDDYYMYDYELDQNGPAFLIPRTNRVFARFNSDTKRDIYFNLSLASSTSINDDELLESMIQISSKFGDSYFLKLGFEQASFNSSFDFIIYLIPNCTLLCSRFNLICYTI